MGVNAVQQLTERSCCQLRCGGRRTQGSRRLSRVLGQHVPAGCVASLGPGSRPDVGPGRQEAGRREGHVLDDVDPLGGVRGAVRGDGKAERCAVVRMAWRARQL